MFCCHLYCQKKLSIELVRHPHQRACWEKAPAKAHLVTDDLTLYLCQRLSPPISEIWNDLSLRRVVLICKISIAFNNRKVQTIDTIKIQRGQRTLRSDRDRQVTRKS